MCWSHAGAAGWVAHRYEQQLMEVFATPEVVYLSPDATEVLQDVDMSKVGSYHCEWAPLTWTLALSESVLTRDGYCPGLRYRGDSRSHGAEKSDATQGSRHSGTSSINDTFQMSFSFVSYENLSILWHCMSYCMLYCRWCRSVFPSMSIFLSGVPMCSISTLSYLSYRPMPRPEIGPRRSSLGR